MEGSQVFTHPTHMATDQELERLLADSRPWLFRLALAITAQRELAEDAAQNALIRASRSRGTLANAQEPKAWLRKVLVRCALDEVADRKPFVAAREVIGSHVTDDNLAVRQTLDRLTNDQRALLALAHFEQLSYREMAEALGIPEGTVASRLHQAREAFRKEWAR